MQIILQKAVFNDEKLKSYVTKLTINELNNLSEPCYYPDWKRHFYEILHLTGLDEKSIKDFIKRFYYGTKAQNSLLQSDVGSNLLIILMYHFLQKKDQSSYSAVMLYHMIRQYGNFLRISLRFCKPEVFIYTLNHLNPTHLFSREKTISNAIFHLSTEMKKRYTAYITELNAEKISSMLYESRGRIAQSIKSFSELYYKNESKGYGILNPEENEEGNEYQSLGELNKNERIAEFVSNKICVYKEIDYKALEQARSLTKINSSYATIIVNKLQDTSLTNEIKFILELFLKNVKSVNDICGKNFIPYVKKLMSIKRTSKEVYFKSEINKLLLKIIKESKIDSKYKLLTSQTQFQFNSFLAFYITIYTKNLIC